MFQSVLHNITMLMHSDDRDHWEHNEHLIHRFVNQFPENGQEVMQIRKARKEYKKDQLRKAAVAKSLGGETQALQIKKPVDYSVQL